MSRSIAATVVAAPLVLLAPEAVTAKPKKSPDLVATRLQGLPASAAPGDKVVLRSVVKNRGTNAAKKSKISFLLSTDRERSSDDRVMAGQATVPALKPGKQSAVTVGATIPTASSGTQYVLGCVKKVKGERGKQAKNNCASYKRQISIEPAGSGYPEAFVGTATAVHSYSFSCTGVEEIPPCSGTETKTITTSATFERVEHGDGYRYITDSGDLEWSITGDEDYGTETCTLSGGSELPVRSSGDGQYAIGYLDRIGDGTFAPGDPYWRASNFRTGGSPSPRYTRTCEHADGTSTSEPGFSPKLWLQVDSDRCDVGHDGVFFVTGDGSLAGQDFCDAEDEWTLGNGNTFTSLFESQVTWELTPVSG